MWPAMEDVSTAAAFAPFHSFKQRWNSWKPVSNQTNLEALAQNTSSERAQSLVFLEHTSFLNNIALVKVQT